MPYFASRDAIHPGSLELWCGGVRLAVRAAETVIVGVGAGLVACRREHRDASFAPIETSIDGRARGSRARAGIS